MKQPIICFFGQIYSQYHKDKIDETLTGYYFDNDQKLYQILREINPHLLVSIGNKEEYSQLNQLNDDRKWLHYQDADKIINDLWNLYQRFVDNSIEKEKNDLVSIFTTSYNSQKYINRPYESLLKQTYDNWEWVIVDDSNGDENWRNLVTLREKNPLKIRVYRSDKNSGIIGHVKQLASSLCRGSYVVEMDHDDELTPKALEFLVKAGKMYPEAGFFYSDFCEIHENGDNFSYGDHFALGYGAYRKQYDEKFGKWINICAAPPINHMTIRYLVGCPNHYRAWRMSTFREIGGWNGEFHVADDYEIIVRSFLSTKMVRVPYMSYYQYRNSGGNNHTFIRNREIQKLWRTISRHYNTKISKRLVELTDSDPYEKTWENWRQLNKCWLQPRYDIKLNLVYPIQGSVFNPLVSIVLLSNQDEANLSLGIDRIINQDYDTLEMMIVGAKCQYLENTMNELVKSNENRVKKDINWWNLQNESNDVELLNYCLKLINLGTLTFIMDNKNLSCVDDKLVSRAVESFRNDLDLQAIFLKDTNHVIHRTSLYEKYGYFCQNKNILDIWREKEKNIEW